MASSVDNFLQRMEKYVFIKADHSFIHYFFGCCKIYCGFLILGSTHSGLE